MRKLSVVLILGLLAVLICSGQALAVSFSIDEVTERVTNRLENRIERQFDRIAEIYERNPERAERRFDRFLARIERRINRIEERRGIDIPIDLPQGTYASFISEPTSPCAAPVPEPGTILLMAAGLGGLGLISRKKFPK